MNVNVDISIIEIILETYTNVLGFCCCSCCCLVVFTNALGLKHDSY